jgi:two-component system, chemotaxis family, chemotaxis protein CheY
MSGPKVLFVDDQEFVLAIVKKMLEQVGIQHVTTAKDGVEALEKAKKSPPDIVICDIQMRPMDGFAFYTALQSDPELQAIPVLMLSAHQDSSISNRAREMGVKAVLSKPIQGQALREAIETILR